MSIDSLPNKFHAEQDNYRRNEFIKMVEENKDILEVSSIDDIITITVGYDELKKLINLTDTLINGNMINTMFMNNRSSNNVVDNLNSNKYFLRSIVEKYDKIVLKFKEEN